ncbi:MAG TPA: HlyD family secretion protein [Terriglobia bacterium]|jgi:membrane fusion protein (multidrug efflux system)|nr:HlyD family secretion protein [Terriglobia bacterium]
MADTATQTPETPGRGESTRTATPGVGAGSIPPRRRKTRKVVALVVLALVVVPASVLLYRYIMSYESTDDAQIDGYIYPVSARVPGYVVRVTVDDNQYVQAGTVLTQLDPKDYDVAVANSKATLANDKASSEALRINVPLTSVNTDSQLSTAQADVQNAQAGLAGAEQQFDAAQASLREAEANDLKAQDDVTRYKPLAAKDEIPQQQYTQAVDTQKATAAAVEAARSSAAAAEQAVTQARARIAQAQAGLHYAETRPQQISVQRSRAQAAEAQTEQAAAALQQAELNLQYTTIVAPISGIVGQRSVQPGQNVSPGQQLMTIVPLDSQNIWVTANFKETQLNYMRPGQPVKISVDTYDRSYDGHVLNIAGASGALYSLLPPENATGNYVKVVQRIPVKIVFEKGQDPEHLLRPGMSVEPKVMVK